jgi:DNA repair photolyase
MRWSGQEIEVEQGDALPGLVKLSSLVRSVQTPEFAGITFHEVLAKSALNHVPGAANALPFGWTINPYRGCSHACSYCLSPETLILMGDGRQKPLRSVRVGDEIYGTQERGTSRRYVKTTVLASWNTRRRPYRIALVDGTEIMASGDHRFLSDRGWTYVTGASNGAGRRPHLSGDTTLMGFGSSGLSSSATGSLEIENLAVRSRADLGVMTIDDLGGEVDMIDITTGTGDFVANGVISHNCFARQTHSYLDLDTGKDFDSQIIVKVNVAEVLEKELAKPSWGRHPVALGTNTDPYQRAEGRYRLMPGVIAALAASGTPLSILTKGTLLRRDLPLLQEAGAHVPVELSMSIAIYDDELQQAVEPGTPSTAARLATVTAIRDAGMGCSVFLMPVLPFLTDTVAHLDRAFGMIAAAGATSVTYSALHLRPGAREWYLSWIARDHPELVTRYAELYRGGSYAPKGYRAWLAARVHPLLRRHGLDRPRDLDPSTGVLRAGSRPGTRGLIAAELSPASAAALQPTLF